MRHVHPGDDCHPIVGMDPCLCPWVCYRTVFAVGDTPAFVGMDPIDGCETTDGMTLDEVRDGVANDSVTAADHQDRPYGIHLCHGLGGSQTILVG